MYCKPSENSARERGCVIADPCVIRRLRVRASGCHQRRECQLLGNYLKFVVRKRLVATHIPNGC